VIARLAGNPDDVSAAPDGSMWVSDSDLHAVVHLSGTGVVLGRIQVNDPEGAVVLPDGQVAVADQAGNRIVVIAPKPGAPAKVLAALPAAAGPRRGSARLFLGSRRRRRQIHGPRRRAAAPRRKSSRSLP